MPTQLDSLENGQKHRQIRRAAIVGGTHGNELIGAYLVKKFVAAPQLVQRSSFESTVLLANPRAFVARQRYVERDLNRCFSLDNLQDAAAASYEDSQARAIYQQLGSGSHKADFIVDLHSTTANMGLTIILTNRHPFNLRLAAYLSGIHPAVKIYSWMDSQKAFLRSISELGCAVEVGPVAQGLLDAALFEQTQALVYSILDYLEAANRGLDLALPDSLTLYECTAMVDYPKTEQGELAAMIHPQLQSRDYQPLHPGDAMFLSFDGTTIPYSGETAYPVFINEAAYYEKGIALCLTQRQQVNLPSQ
jgi:aspartoacylase